MKKSNLIQIYWPFKIYENLPAVKANIEAGELFINDLTQPL